MTFALDCFALAPSKNKRIRKIRPHCWKLNSIIVLHLKLMDSCHNLLCRVHEMQTQGVMFFYCNAFTRRNYCNKPIIIILHIQRSIICTLIKFVHNHNAHIHNYNHTLKVFPLSLCTRCFPPILCLSDCITTWEKTNLKQKIPFNFFCDLLLQRKLFSMMLSTNVNIYFMISLFV